MSECQRIADELERIFRGEAWHGPSVLRSLQGLTFDDAITRPVANAHTVYEIVHHMAAWISEVHRRLIGLPPGAPSEGDFPPANATPTPQSWASALAWLERAHDDLVEAIERTEDEKLERTMGSERTSFYVMLHGVVQHDAYHAGQLSLLRRALGKT